MITRDSFHGQWKQAYNDAIYCGAEPEEAEMSADDAIYDTCVKPVIGDEFTVSDDQFAAYAASGGYIHFKFDGEYLVPTEMTVSIDEVPAYFRKRVFRKFHDEMLIY